MLQLDRPRRQLAIAAAGLAGFVDASGFLAADRYFVSFMSGNTTRLGVDLVTGSGRAWVPLLLIGGFLLGVIGGALLAAQAGARRKPVMLGTVAMLLAFAAVAQTSGVVVAMMALLVLAMGALNNTFQREGEVAVGLTYMTGALVRMGQGIAARLAGNGGEGWASWGLLWLGLAGGALAGAYSWLHWPHATLWLAAGWAAALAFAAPHGVEQVQS
jgi:uncharacterized membrane protein YoaK (UPF0700 family)